MKIIRRIPKVLRAYWRARKLRFANRADLYRHQLLMLKQFTTLVSEYSPYYRAYAGAPLSDWPLMDKGRMLANFDAINTAGLRLDDVMAAALAGERSRDFTRTLRGYTVGLSSGTSGRRGVFVVSDQERAAWAGTLLSKALPGALFDPGHRVALLLRANSNLYETVNLPWLKFRFFDLFGGFEATARALACYRPTVVVAPAQVLRELALSLDKLPKFPAFRAISVAEVLDVRDRAIIECAFGPVHELYQATEGFIGATCSHNRLHLNEEYLLVEPEWLQPDAEGRTRFVPVVTDFSRLAQPIVRYRLDDILVASSDPCPCGNAAMAIDAIEGRCDDALVLPDSSGKARTMFADIVSRTMALTLPPDADYQLVQHGARHLRLQTTAGHDATTSAGRALLEVLGRQGVDIGALVLDTGALSPRFEPSVKRRRIVKAYRA